MRAAHTNGYAEPAASAEVPRPLRPADLDRLFRRSRGWFNRDRTRKRLYAKGFPHAFERGLWSPVAVAAWMAGAGSNPDNVPPDERHAEKPARRKAGKPARRKAGKPKRRRPAGANGYAEVTR